jgi:hypothetical protein
MLRGFTKGYVVGSGVPSSPDADKTITGGEAGPNPCMVHMWNVVNRTCPSLEESLSQDRPTAWSAKDEGRSEGPPVMGWIRIASQEKIILRESGQTSLWSFRARALE